MSDEIKLTSIILSAVVAVVVIIAGSITYFKVSIAKIAMENGYSQQTLLGEEEVHWVKDDKVLGE